MNQYKAEVVLDSIVNNVRVTCMLITYPRMVHSEELRHRINSICSNSSRAIGNRTLIKKHYGYIPTNWRKHQKGMQPIEGKPFNTLQEFYFKMVWKLGVILNKWISKLLHLNENGLAKELANRWLEPALYITHLVQTTEEGYDSFFKLRLAEDAQWEIREIAKLMYEEYSKSKPVVRDVHLPFYQKDYEDHKISLKNSALCSSARCARTSYKNHDGSTPLMEEDLKLSGKLFNDKHMSPFEFPVISHNYLLDNLKYFEVATKMTENLPYERVVNVDKPSIQMYKNLSGNLNNWKVVQFRKILENGINL